MQYDSIDQIKKRTERYWYEDGIWEIGFGLVTGLLSLFFVIANHFTWQGPAALLLMLLQMGFILGAFLLINRFVGFLKSRITYPRTGYVAYPRRSASTRFKRGVRTALVAAATAGLVGLVAAIQSLQNSLPLVTSVIIAAALIYLGYRFSLLRFYAIAVLTIAWGYLLSVFGKTQTMNAGPFFAGFSLLMLFSGIITLILYLRHTRPAEEDQMMMNLIENGNETPQSSGKSDQP